jgi:chorismate mutase / prephenate dehydratase
MDDELNLLRARIDQTDAQILDLLNARARLAQQVGEFKHQTGAAVYRPEREAQVLAQLGERSAGPLQAGAVRAIYREVIAACRELERRLRVAYLGPPGTFSEQAAVAHFGSQVELVAEPSFDDVFRATAAGAADFGVVGVENSSEGVVNRSLDLMLGSELKICGEVSLPIAHCLMSASGTMAGVRRVCAHPQALAQCAGWLSSHHPHLVRDPAASNAEGARLAGEDPTVAGIAAATAADRYGVQIVAHNIQDDPHNRTRFVVLGQHECAPSGKDMTTLILSVPDRAGAVHALIEPLARHGISMKRFESRLLPRPARSQGRAGGRGGAW